MFEEDERGDLLVVAAERTVSQLEPDVEPDVQIVVASEPEPEPEPEIVRVKTLREMFYETEPWYASENQYAPSPGIRRLMEKRVNRALTAVADWMLGLVEQHVGDEMALVVLLEQAEAIRGQIIWPEREAQEAQEQEQ